MMQEIFVLLDEEDKRRSGQAEKRACGGILAWMLDAKINNTHLFVLQPFILLAF
jgi:hypothetical protein